jgi:hypothetical protein
MQFSVAGTTLWDSGSIEFPTTSSDYYDWYAEIDVVFTSATAGYVQGRLVIEGADASSFEVRGHGADRTAQNNSFSGLTGTYTVDFVNDWGASAGAGDIIACGIASIDQSRNSNE